MSELPDNAPTPRSCHIVKWPDFDGYGFNLHADKNRQGQYIGKVDEHSPAEMAGLKQGDRIIEVNSVNVANENHKQVVSRIKTIANETTLLVVDKEADQWYKSHNLVVKGDQSNVVHGTSKRTEPQTNGNHEEADRRSVSSAASSSHSESSSHPQPSITDSIQGSHVEGGDPVKPSVLNGILEHPQNEADVPTESANGSSKQDNEVNRSVEPLHNDLVCVDVVPISDVNSSKKVETPQNGIHHDQCDKESVEFDSVVNAKKVDAKGITVVSPSHERSDSDLAAEYDNVIFKKDAESESHSTEKSDAGRSSVSEKSDSNADNGSQETDLADDNVKTPMSTSPSPPPSVVVIKGLIPDTKTTPSTTSATSPSAKKVTNDTSGLNLNMSAAEMRAHLASRKKFDPRKDSVDLRKKYEIIQNM